MSRLKVLHKKRRMKMCKAFSLENRGISPRRALPYAVMCQGFTLRFPKKSTIGIRD